MYLGLELWEPVGGEAGKKGLFELTTVAAEALGKVATTPCWVLKEEALVPPVLPG